MTLVAAGQKSREEIVNYFARLFRGRLVRKWSHVWDALVCYSSDLYPAELIDDIKRAYEEDLVDLGYIGFDDVQRDLAIGKDRVLARLAEDPHRRLVKDTAKEMEWWACFRDDRAQGPTQPWATANLNPPPRASSSPISTKFPKTGRNDPCPCGFGEETQEVLRRGDRELTMRS